MREWRACVLQAYACVCVAEGGAALWRGATCAAAVERGRVALGGEFGLALLDLERAELVPRRAAAPVHRLRYVPREQLLGEQQL